MKKLTWKEVETKTLDLSQKIIQNTIYSKSPVPIKIGYVPRGGIVVALLLRRYLSCVLVSDPKEADVIVDDIVDSGATRDAYIAKHHKPFFSLIPQEDQKEWIVFPWESESELGPEENVKRIIQYIGDDVSREGLRETPSRVVKSYAEIFAGYKQDPSEIMKTFSDGTCDEMVVLKDIEFYSVCEHHMQPFFGKAHIAYLPNEQVLGVSKLARILDIYAKRLQIQERMTQQVTRALMEPPLYAKGAACLIEAKHFCMVCRGVGKQNSVMVTSSLEGVFRTDNAVRAEFLSIVKG